MKSRIFAVMLLSAQCLLAQTDAIRGRDNTLLDDRSEKGFTSIFNGKDLTGWTGDPRLWSVKDGAITGQTTPENPAKGNTFLIWTNGTVSDFELRCSFKLGANNDKGFANSGIQYRSKVLDPANWVVGGYQADMEAGPTYTGILYEERMSRGIMAERGQKVVWDKDCKKQVVGSLGTSEELQKMIKQGDWNHYVVIAQGNHLQQFINGRQTVDVVDDCESKRAMSGVLALQLHAGPPMAAQFRDLRIKTLSGVTATAASTNPDLEKMQGKWQVTSGQVNGESLPAEMITNMVLTITGTNYTAVISEGTDQGNFSIDSSKSPKEIDIQSEAGDRPHIIGIYETGADSIRVCMANEGGPRPKSFSTTEDSRFLLLEYKRKKE
jgi:uncharacterized protein (TIGR03067 family)